MNTFNRICNCRAAAEIFRLTGKIFFLLAVLLLLNCFPDFLKDDKTEVATTLERSIVDLSTEPPQTLLATNDQELAFRSGQIESLLKTTKGRLVIDEATDLEIRKVIPQHAYAVKVRLCIERTTRIFLVDREDFNALRVGVIAKFIMNSNESAIDSLIAY